MAGITIYCENNNFVKLPCSPRAVPWVKNKTRAAKKSIKPTGYIINALGALDFIKINNLFYLCRRQIKNIKLYLYVFSKKTRAPRAGRAYLYYLFDFIKKLKKRKFLYNRAPPWIIQGTLGRRGEMNRLFIVENIILEWELRIPITLIYRLIDEPEICQRDLEGGGR